MTSQCLAHFRVELLPASVRNKPIACTSLVEHGRLLLTIVVWGGRLRFLQLHAHTSKPHWQNASCEVDVLKVSMSIYSSSCWSATSLDGHMHVPTVKLYARLWCVSFQFGCSRAFEDLTLDTVIVHFVIHIVIDQSIDGSEWFL